MECIDVQKSVKKFLDNELSKDEERELYFHLKKCQSCYDSFSKDYLLFSLLEENNSKMYDGDFTKVLQTIYDNIVSITNRKVIIYIIDTLVIWSVVWAMIAMVALVWKY